MSVTGELHSPTAFASQLPDDVPIVVYAGAMASGHITREEHPEIGEMISLSQYPLSGASALNRLLGAVEAQWGVV